jgi:hypothetical protein
VILAGWSVRLPDGWSARRDPELGREEGRIPPDIDDETTRLLLEQSAALLDAMLLTPGVMRFGIPRAMVVLAVADRTDASIERITDGLLVAADRVGPNPPVALKVRRGEGAVAGYRTVRIEGEVPIGRQLDQGGWIVRTALRLLGVDPIRFRLDLFERAQRRYGFGLAAGGRDYRRYLTDLEAIAASSDWEAAP